MKNPFLFLIAFLLTACTTVEVSHRAPTEKSNIHNSSALHIDTPAAMLTKPYTFPVQNKTLVTCRFELVKAYYNEDWYPSLAIAFSKRGDFSNDAVGEQHVKFSAFFTDTTIGRQYEITTWNNEQSVRAPFMRVIAAKSTITLSMAWYEDGYFSYRVDELYGTSGTASLYRPEITPAVATVLVSGIRGNLHCDSTVIPDDEAALD